MTDSNEEDFQLDQDDLTFLVNELGFDEIVEEDLDWEPSILDFNSFDNELRNPSPEVKAALDLEYPNKYQEK